MSGPCLRPRPSYEALAGALSVGSRFNASGPTAAFVVILFPIVTSHGIGGLLIATLMATLILWARLRRADQAPPWLSRWCRRLDPRRAWRRLSRRGLLGVVALVLALASCYGTLALAALLPLLGVGLAINEGAWATTIAVFVLLTLGVLGAGYRRHRATGPPLLAGAGAALVLYALFIDYRALVELAGFVLLTGAALWDLYQRRRQEARLLGLPPARSRRIAPQ